MYDASNINTTLKIGILYLSIYEFDLRPEVKISMYEFDVCPEVKISI